MSLNHLPPMWFNSCWAAAAFQIIPRNEAVYKAAEEQPHNKLLHSSMAAGVDLEVFHHCTPRSVCEFLIWYSNTWNSGQKQSFVQQIREYPKAVLVTTASTWN
eukprot:TRINITY_DN22235_c0_g1_i2.p2 TRINITY_DN22235_c0_g1~~TRINITY_DN22235_c0_g1_i2.p2  ORF type:complete len:103 (-),score=11.75 TRINITY_DN22235_c0_g1_i2:125-433(-)